MAKKSNENCGMPVRRDVLNRVYRNPCRMQKLPSAQEYATLFGISSRSVTLELKKLMEEGIIIGRQGKGTYTNPQLQKLDNGTNPRLIGLLYNGGDNFYYTRQNWHLLAFAGEELTRQGFYVQPIIGGINGRISLQELLKQNYCDAFLCLEPKDELWTVIDQYPNVFSVEFPTHLDRCISFSYSNAIAQFRQLMNRENRKKILFLGNPCAAWIKRSIVLFQENGFDADDLFLFTCSFEKNNIDELRQFVVDHEIDVVAAFPDELALLENISDSCIPLLLKESISPPWHGCYFRIPYENAIQNAVELLKQYFLGVPISKTQLEVELITPEINMGK